MHNPYKDYSNINPQREDGHRRIENTVFQALIRADLPGIEYSLVLYILDKTWGFNKKEDVIPLSQFAEATLQDRSNIRKSLQSLSDKHIILINNLGPGRGKGNIYMFNKYWDTWKIEKWLPTPHLASNVVEDTTIIETPGAPQEMLSPAPQLASIVVAPTTNRKVVENTTKEAGNVVKTEGNVVGHAQGNVVKDTPSIERIKKPSKETPSPIKKEKKIYYGNVHLYEEEFNKLVERFGQAGADDRIEALSLYIKSRGAEHKYKDHYATILNWERRDKEKEKGSAEKKEKGASYGAGQQPPGPGTGARREDPLKTTRERGWETGDDKEGEDGA